MEQTKNHETFPVFNLMELNVDTNPEYRAKFAEFKKKITDYSDINPELGLKTGDVVTFISGYNSDLKYTTEILGFDEDGKAFMLWDCYWFPVDLIERKFVKL
jgi:hypothetical protein